MITSRIDQEFKIYGEAHQDRLNRWCHAFGVPLLMIGILGLLSRITFGPAVYENFLFRPDLGMFFLASILMWFCFLDWKLAVPFSLFVLAMYWFGRAIHIEWLIILLITGFGLQFLGHITFEKKPPSFKQSVRFLFVGPLWLFARWVGYID